MFYDYYIESILNMVMLLYYDSINWDAIINEATVNQKLDAFVGAII